MYFYDYPEHKEKGIDYDLYTCLEFNGQENFSVYDIKQVLAVYEGYNDRDSWHWVLELKEPIKSIHNKFVVINKYIYLTGWCDYTGWDCRSDAWSEMCPSAVAAAHMATIIEQDEDHPGHDLHNVINSVDVSASLLNQLSTKKLITWREGMDEEFGL